MAGDYYVYVHKRKSDGHIFYVGKGKGRRSSKLTGRTATWKHYVATRCDGLIDIEHVAHFATEAQALDHEQALIRKYSGQILNEDNNQPFGFNGSAFRHYESLKLANHSLIEHARKT